jgi:hypothetical protein
VGIEPTSCNLRGCRSHQSSYRSVVVRGLGLEPRKLPVLSGTTLPFAQPRILATSLGFEPRSRTFGGSGASIAEAMVETHARIELAFWRLEVACPAQRMRRDGLPGENRTLSLVFVAQGPKAIGGEMW